DPEALRLIRLGRHDEPERPVVETGLRAAPGEVPEVRFPIDRKVGAHRIAPQALEERFAPGERVPLEVGLAVPRLEKREIAVGLRHGGHDSCSRLATMITSAVATRSARAAMAISADAGPSGATSVGTPLPTKPPTGVIMDSPFTLQDTDRPG